MRLCVKIGGALLERPHGRSALAQAIADARTNGHEVLVVHGGGAQIGQVANRLGLIERRHEGLRITDDDTARVVTWVLAGEVNKGLVDALRRSGITAVGLTGADLDLFTPRTKTAAGVDLGWVGELTAADVRPAALEPLFAAGFVPVVATIGPSSEAGEPFLNVNADEAAGPLAAACGCQELIVLSDVPGVHGTDGQVIQRLNTAEVSRLIEAGVIHDGMIPKVRAALAALESGVSRVRVLDGNGPDPIGAALAGSGTEFHR